MSDTIDKNLNLQESQQEENLENEKLKLQDRLRKPIDEMSFSEVILASQQERPKDDAGIDSKEIEWDRHKDAYITKFGDKAEEVFSQVYNNIAAKEAERDVEKAQVFANTGYILGKNQKYFDMVEGKDYIPGISVTLETNSGRKEILDQWTDPSRSIRTAALESATFIDKAGKVHDVPNGLYEGIIGNPDYADDNGNLITIFEYTGGGEYERGTSTVKAVYEGDTPTGEVVSKWDAAGWFKGNDLDMSLWRVPVATTVNFAVDLADTAFAFMETAAVITTFGKAKESEFYKDIRDSRNKFKSWQIAKSDKDQASMFTVNNMLDIGLNVGLQALSGRAMAAGFGALYGAIARNANKVLALYEEAQVAEKAMKTAKTAAEVRKYKTAMDDALENAKHLKSVIDKRGAAAGKSTLFMLGAMASKEASDEALKAGFTPEEAAMIYFISLGGMMWVNQLSKLGFERLGVNSYNKVASNVVKKEFAGVDKTILKNPNKLNKLLQNVGDGIVNNYKAITSKTSYASYMLSEAVEEEAELIMQEVVNHTANLYSAIRYKGAEDRPKFKTVTDEGYWSEFMTESVASILGGAMGGAMNRGLFISKAELKGIKEEELPISGKEADAFKQIAFSASRTAAGQQMEAILLQELQRKKDNGESGSKTLSTKYDKDKGRYKLMSELTADEKTRYRSQADTMHDAMVAQYMYYKTSYAMEDGTFKEITASNPNLGYIQDSEELQHIAMRAFDNKARLMGKSKTSVAALEDGVAALIKLRETQTPDENGHIDVSKYNEEIDKLSGATELSVSELNSLVEESQTLKAVQTGEILERAFMDMMTDRVAYRDVLGKGRLESLVKSDVEFRMKFSEDHAKAKELQDETDSKLKAELSTGKLSTNTEEAILSGKLLLSNESKQALEEHLDTLGTPFAVKKATALRALYNDLKTTIKNSASATKYFSDLKDEFGIDFLTNLDKAIKNSPEDLSDTLSGLNAAPDLVYDIDPELDPEAYNEAVNDIFKVAYIASVMDKVSKASKVSLPETKYDIDGLRFDNAQSIIGDGLYIPGHVYSTDNLTKTIDIAAQDTDLEMRKAELLNSINASRTVVESDEVPDFGFLQDFNTSNPNKPTVVGETLEGKLQTLLKGAVTDTSGNLISFGDESAAKDLKTRIDTRLAQVRIILESLSWLADIDEVNKKYFNTKNKNMTYFTDYLKGIGIDPAILKENPEQAQLLANRLAGYQRRLINIGNTVELLIGAASKSVDSLRDAYITDTLKYAEGTIKSVHNVLTSSKSDALIKKYPQLNEVLKRTNGLEFTSTTKENMDEVFQNLYEIRSLLNEVYLQNQTTFLNDLVKISSTQRGNDERVVGFLALSQADYMYGKLKETYTTLFNTSVDDENALELLKLPTIKHLQLAEEAFVSTTSEFLDFVQKLKKSGYSKSLPVVVLEGRQGTGKTSVVAVEAALIIQQYLTEQAILQDGDNAKIPSIIFASNSEEQAEKVRTLAEEANVISGSLHGKRDIDQTQLWNFIVNDDLTDAQLAAALSGVGAIIYDEASFLEFVASNEEMDKAFSNPKEAPVLNAIAARLSKVSEIRRAEGKAPLTLILLGDSKQGGYAEGLPNPRFKSVTGKPTGGMLSAYETDAVDFLYKSETVLTHPFRFLVGEIQSATADVLTKLNPMLSSVKKLSPIELSFNRGSDMYSGVEIDSWSNIQDDEDLVKELRKQLGKPITKRGNGPDFNILIISGNNDYDGSITDSTLLGQLLLEYKGDPRISLKGVYSVKGAEADYAIVNMPKDHLPYSESDILNLEGKGLEIYINNLRTLSMVMGRARKYVNIAMNNSLPITSNPGTTTILKPNESNAFKKQWGNILLGSILAPYQGIASVKPAVKTNETITITQEETAEVILEDIEEGKIIIMSDGSEYVVDEIIDSVIMTVDPIDSTEGPEVPVSSVLSGEIKIKKEESESITRQITSTTTLPALYSPTKSEVPVESDGEFIPDPITSGKEHMEVLEPFGIESVDVVVIEKKKKELEDDSKSNPTRTADNQSAAIILNNYKAIIEDSEIGPDFEVLNSLTIVDDQDANKLKEIEKSYGLVLAYPHISPDLTNTKSIATSRNYISTVYGDSSVPRLLGDSSDYIDYETHLYNALGLGPNGKLGMNDYDYEFVTYEFKNNSALEYTHAIVAKHTITGKRVMVSKFGPSTMYNPEGDTDSYRGRLWKMMVDREAELASAVDTYSVTGNLPETTSKYNMVEVNNTAMLSSVPPRDKSLGTKLFRLTSKIASIDLIIDGTTVGNTVESNKTIHNIAKESDSIKALVPNINSLNPYSYKTKTTLTTKNKIAGVKEGQYFKPFKDWVNPDNKNTVPFELVVEDSKAYVFFEVDGNIFVVVKTDKGKISFFREDGKWVPAVGYDIKNKKPILSYDRIAGDLVDADLANTSTVLSTLTPSQQYTKSFNPSVVAEGIASQFNYNNNEFQELTTVEAKISYANWFLTNKLQSFFGNIQLPLNIAKNLWKTTGGPNTTSAPYVIMRGPNTGKSVMFYSFRSDINLEDMSEQQILNMFAEMVESQQTKNSPMTDNRNGIGYIILDSKPTTLAALDSMYIGVDNQFITKHMNKVAMSGATERSLMSLLANLHYVINPSNRNARLESMINFFEQEISKEELQAWYTANKASLASLQGFLQEIFKPEALGKLAIAGVDEDVQDLSHVLQEIRSRKSFKSAEEIEADMQIAYDDFVQIVGNKEKLDKIGINRANLSDLLVKGGADSKGNIAINSNGKPYFIKNSNSVISYIDSEWLNTVSNGTMELPPKFNLNALLGILNRQEMLPYKNSIIKAIDELIPKTKGLRKGLYVSPLAVDTKQSIAKAIPSSSIPLEQMLTTSVKQIRMPSIVFDVKLNPEDRFLPVIKSSKAVDTVVNVPQAVTTQTTDYDSIFGKAATQRELAGLYKSVIKKLNKSKEKDVEKEKTNALASYKKAMASLTANPDTFKFNKVSLIDFVGDSVVDEVKLELLKSFENLKPAIRNNESFEMDWVSELEIMYGEELPVKVQEYINLVRETGIDEIPNQIFWKQVKQLKDSGVNLPIFDINALDFNYIKAVEDWKSGKNLMSDRLMLLLAYNSADSDLKSELERMIDTDPFDQELINERVFVRVSSQEDPDEKLNILYDYLSDIKNNYYNINSKLNTLNALQQVINSLPDDYAWKNNLLNEINDFLSSGSDTRLGVTSTENIVNTMDTDTIFLEQVTADKIALFKDVAIPIIESLPSAYFLWDYVNGGYENMNTYHDNAIDEFATALMEVPGLSISKQEELLDTFNKLVTCK